MTDKLEAVVEELRDEEARLKTRATELEAELKAIRDRHKQVQTALMALGGKATGQTHRDVMESVTDLLTERKR